jgi:hypothetical protein
MSDEITLSQKTYHQVLNLLGELVADSLYQDSLDKKKDPLKYSGESFMTNKLKLIKETLKNEN